MELLIYPRLIILFVIGVINFTHTFIHSRINKIGYLNDLVRRLYVTAVSDPYVSPITGGPMPKASQRLQ